MGSRRYKLNAARRKDAAVQARYRGDEVVARALGVKPGTVKQWRYKYNISLESRSGSSPRSGYPALAKDIIPALAYDDYEELPDWYGKTLFYAYDAVEIIEPASKWCDKYSNEAIAAHGEMQKEFTRSKLENCYPNQQLISRLRDERSQSALRAQECLRTAETAYETSKYVREEDLTSTENDILWRAMYDARFKYQSNNVFRWV